MNDKPQRCAGADETSSTPAFLVPHPSGHKRGPKDARIRMPVFRVPAAAPGVSPFALAFSVVGAKGVARPTPFIHLCLRSLMECHPALSTSLRGGTRIYPVACRKSRSTGLSECACIVAPPSGSPNASSKASNGVASRHALETYLSALRTRRRHAYGT